MILTLTLPSLCGFSTQILWTQREIQYLHGDFQPRPALLSSLFLIIKLWVYNDTAHLFLAWEDQ